MVFKPSRWVKYWLIAMAIWLIPVAAVVVSEIREEMTYNATALNHALSTWDIPSSASSVAVIRCHGFAEQARAAGCPAEVLKANATRHQEALDEYALRKRTLAHYLWRAFIGYWIVPAILLLAIGLVIAALRRALRPGTKNATS